MSSLQVMGKGLIRKSFNKVDDIIPVPNLIEIQSRSFNELVQLDFLPSERKTVGLEKVLKDVFPVEYGDKLSLEYVSYELGDWACTCGKLKGIEERYYWTCTSCKKSDCSRLSEDMSCLHCKKKTARYKTCATCLSRVTVQLAMTVDECRANGQTFSLPLKVKMQLLSWDGEGKNRTVRDIKEQSIFFADVPVMTDLILDKGRFELGNEGTFLINGIDRVVVSQLHRSPGVIFAQSKKVKDVRGRPYFIARIIPMRGSWVDFEFDSSDYLYVRIDKKKKFLVTTFLQALGIPRDEIIPLFYSIDTVTFKKGEIFTKIDTNLIGRRIEKGMLDDEHDSFIGKRLTKELIEEFDSLKIKKLLFSDVHLLNRTLAADIIDATTGEILAERSQVINQDLFDRLSKINEIVVQLVSTSGYVFQPTIAKTLSYDDCYSQEEALKEFHTKVWPGDNSSLEEIKERINTIFFNPRYYDLTRVGRIRMNRKLGLSVAEDIHVLTREDFIATVKYLVGLRERAEGELDDIDHLGNRRVRLVGELLSNQVHLGFLRIERIVKERFRMQEAFGTLMPQDLLNVKPLGAVLREFFGTGQLSQFMDQTNPLSEIAHKRRLSALGPGGVLKDRATYEVRDVHTSHYGRICPIETPEGQTIGLISSLSTYATVNDLGFIETAYRNVKKGKIEEETVIFLDAFEENDRYIAQADAVEPGKSVIKTDSVVVRHNTNFEVVKTDKVDCIDLSPKQLVSVSTALIPFLEHDDASRALMGSNMQRQAVPLIKTNAPLIGTGMEKEIGKSSNSLVAARRSGIVEYVSADKIIIRANENEFENFDSWVTQGVDIYHLRKFQKSSMSTWVHHTPIVKRGDIVKTGEVLTNGASMDNGELALGANLIVAYMPWHGYNFEDAIVLSQRLVFDDVFTSVTLEEYVVDARDTKLGPEEITRDIPNVGESSLEGLDEDGIVHVGSRVKPGDILVGKVTLKGDVQYSPEEKLLHAIFGEKSREVRDTSLRVPPGVEGMVVDVKIFSRSGIRKDKRYKDEVIKQIKKLETDFEQHMHLLGKMITGKVIAYLSGKKPVGKGNESVLNKAGLFDDVKLLELNITDLFNIRCSGDVEANELIEQAVSSYTIQLQVLQGLKEEKINKLKKGDPLPSGVIKMVKVYVAMKRHISVGDKIAGRHGNKGVISNIVPREDMPYLEDGTSVDVVLNPLGVPSRMNVGQILEAILGFAGYTIGQKVKQSLVEQGYSVVKTMLTDLFGLEFVEAYAQSNGEQALEELAHKIAAAGFYFKVPVFEGPDFERDIQPLLSYLHLPVNGMYNLRDGRTGEHFNQPVMVGCTYMMKLDHMVDDKLHARSVGPYSLVTQQPLGGKAQFGGQRLGEMEVWALEAHGAAYALQEMLTYKSDDVNGRHRVYDAIVRGEEIPEPGLPESFNVFIKELQSLGLQIDLCRIGKEEVSE